MRRRDLSKSRRHSTSQCEEVAVTAAEPAMLLLSLRRTRIPFTTDCKADPPKGATEAEPPPSEDKLSEVFDKSRKYSISRAIEDDIFIIRLFPASTQPSGIEETRRISFEYAIKFPSSTR
jgi:hypothetical protein